MQMTKLSIAALERIKDRTPQEELYVSETEDQADIMEGLDSGTSPFRTDLDYDGYRSLEESDNGSYNSLNLERFEETPGSLHLFDRNQGLDTGEESLIDPQGNKERD
jgi:hypothetical protein